MTGPGAEPRRARSCACLPSPGLPCHRCPGPLSTDPGFLLPVGLGGKLSLLRRLRAAHPTHSHAATTRRWLWRPGPPPRPGPLSQDGDLGSPGRRWSPCSGEGSLCCRDMAAAAVGADQPRPWRGATQKYSHLPETSKSGENRKEGFVFQ